MHLHLPLPPPSQVYLEPQGGWRPHWERGTIAAVVLGNLLVAVLVGMLMASWAQQQRLLEEVMVSPVRRLRTIRAFQQHACVVAVRGDVFARLRIRKPAGLLNVCHSYTFYVFSAYVQCLSITAKPFSQQARKPSHTAPSFINHPLPFCALASLAGHQHPPRRHNLQVADGEAATGCVAC
jgi:hypothetical protein